MARKNQKKETPQGRGKQQSIESQQKIEPRGRWGSQEKRVYQEYQFNERLPHGMVQTLVYNLASEDGKNLAELEKMAEETPHDAQFKEMGSIKEDIVKILGVIEYFSVELGVPERQASIMTDYYIGRIKQCTTQVALEKIFSRAYGDYRKLCLESKYKRPKDKIRICTEYIETHTESHYDMKLLAEQVGYNPSYLSQKFKKVTGMTITEYGLKCRLKEADVLLRHTDVPISEIAAILCFSSQSHFQKAFKKQYGMTPRSWRLQK